MQNIYFEFFLPSGGCYYPIPRNFIASIFWYINNDFHLHLNLLLRNNKLQNCNNNEKVSIYMGKIILKKYVKLIFLIQ